MGLYSVVNRVREGRGEREVSECKWRSGDEKKEKRALKQKSESTGAVAFAVQLKNARASCSTDLSLAPHHCPARHSTMSARVALLSVLAEAASQEQHRMKTAVDQLQHWETTPQFYSTLQVRRHRPGSPLAAWNVNPLAHHIALSLLYSTRTSSMTSLWTPTFAGRLSSTSRTALTSTGVRALKSMEPLCRSTSPYRDRSIACSTTDLESLNMASLTTE